MIGSNNQMRAFIALIPTQESQVRLRAVQLELAKIYNVPQPDQNPFHVTLRFFSDISEKTYLSMDEKLGKISRMISPFSVMMETVTRFPNENSPLFVVLQDSPAMQMFQGWIAGVNDKSFRPHITLIRSKLEENLSEECSRSLEGLEWFAESCMMVESKEQEGRRVHRILNTYAFSSTE